MNLKEAIQIRKNKKASKNVKRVKAYIKEHYPAYKFKKNQIVELPIDNHLYKNCIVADLYDKKNRIIIQCDDTSNNNYTCDHHDITLLDLTNTDSWKSNIDTFFRDYDYSSNQNSFASGANVIVYGGKQDVIQNNRTTQVAVPSNPQPTIQPIQTVDRDITDLISNTPGWILRSGISTLGIVTIIVLAMSYMIKFPDKISAPAVITTTNPPIAHLVPTNGIIEAISISNDDYVFKGQEMFYLKNTASRDDISTLVSFIDSYKDSDKFRFVINNDAPNNLMLGDLQPLYARFGLLYNEYKQEIKQTNVFTQINTIHKEIDRTKELISIQNKEKRLFNQELELSVKDAGRHQQLHDQGVISDLDQDQFIMKETQMKRQSEGMDNGIIQNKIKIEQLHLQVEQLKEERNNRIQKHQYQIDDVISQIDEAHSKWEKAYIIQSEIDGIVNFSQEVGEGKTVAYSDVLAYTIPEEENNQKLLTAKIPANGISELEIGNKAIIKIDAYPYKEYGALLASISSLSRLPLIQSDAGQLYEVQVSLEDDLKTDYNKELEFTPNMKASVDFITEDKSILERIMHQFLDLINH